MTQDRQFMKRIAQLPDASQKQARYELMAQLLATYSAATAPTEQVEVAGQAGQLSHHGAAVRVMLGFLSRVSLNVRNNLGVSGDTGRAAVQTLVNAATGLELIAATMDLALPAGEEGPVVKELIHVAEELRATADVYWASVREQSPETTKAQ